MNRALAALVVLAVASCHPPAHKPAKTVAAPLAQLDAVHDLAGSWRWIFASEDAQTTRVEDETWQLDPVPGDHTKLAGRYTRAVEIRARDRVPFACNQRAWYRQRAVFDVTATLDPATNTFAIVEGAYRTEPGPCDHGFRHVGAYRATLDGGRLVLAFDGGSQTLLKIGDAPAAATAPSDPWPAKAELLGAWRWDATAFDDDGNLRDETEWWELSRRSDTRLDATYRRRVIVRAPDGKPIACANAPSYRFDDTYILEAQREDDRWHFIEIAATPGDHPCLHATPHRTLDEAIAEQIGDYLVLEWRGKRRQILHR